MTYENLILNNDGSYTFDKNGMPYNCPNFGEWEEEFAQVAMWAKENPDKVGTPPLPPEPPTIAEMAQSMTLTKREFLKLVIGLTSQTDGMTPITLSSIESYISTAPDELRLEWEYATYIERSHPALEAVCADPQFGISPDLLDIMFVNGQELLRRLDANEPLL